MKTIRANTFETNSSSTHSVTIHFDPKSVKTHSLRKNEEGKFVVPWGIPDDPATPMEKIALLAAYLVVTEGEESISAFEKILSEDAGFPVTVNISLSQWQKTALESMDRSNEDEVKDVVRDWFGYYTRTQWDGATKEFMESMGKILFSPENILSWVYSNGGYYTESWFDG